MEGLIKLAESRGARIVRANGSDPRLLIYGANNSPRAKISPWKFFVELKPVNVFCEGIIGGTRLDYKDCRRYKVSVAEDPNKEIFDEYPESFEHEIAENMNYDNKKRSYLAKLLLNGFSRSEDTIFRGIEWPDYDSECYKLEDVALKHVNNLYDEIQNYLASGGEYIDDIGYRKLTELNSFLYGFRETLLFGDVEGILARLTEDFSGALSRQRDIRPELLKIQEDRLRLDITRERFMGDLVLYHHDKSRIDLVLVGRHTVREGSDILAVLERAEVPYVAINAHGN